MAIPILKTKLYIPSPGPTQVSRPHLLERLNAGLAGKLSLISAPAGFGKTTLVSEWIAGCGRPVAWISLDSADNDPARFWTYFIAGSQNFEESIGESTLAMFRAGEKFPIEDVLTPLLNEMAGLSHPFVFVLDDYHQIETRAIHEAMTFLLDHLPQNAHLTIATRADPPLSLARLRGRGQLTELRATDLRFTNDEVDRFMNQILGLNLPSKEITALTTRTEGWIAGLQMAWISLQGREDQDDIKTFIRSFTGSHRHVLDYLLEEVFQRQPEYLQNFLLKTSVLENLIAPLCDALTEGEESASILDGMERANLFIIPLDDERRWYRYHHLFSDLLRQRLGQTAPELIPELHIRASSWYEKNGNIPAAIDHAISAEDHERATALIEQIAEKTLMRSEVATFLKWVENLPQEMVRANTNLSIFRAWALLIDGRSPGDIKAFLQELEEDGTNPKVLPLKTLIELYEGRFPEAVALSRQAMEQLSEQDVFLRGVSAWNLGISLLALGDTDEGIEVLEEAVKRSREMGNVLMAVSALNRLAHQSFRNGRLFESQAIYLQAIELAKGKSGRYYPVAIESFNGLATLLWEWNQLEEAERHLQIGIELAGRGREMGTFNGLLAMARIHQSRGNIHEAHSVLQKAVQMADQSDITDIDDLVVGIHFARFSISQGDLPAAIRWLAARGLDSELTPDALTPVNEIASVTDQHMRKYELIVLARLWIKEKKFKDALALLDSLLPEMIERGRIGLMLEVRILTALAAHGLGDLSKGLSALEEALSIAEPGGYVRTFIDEGEPMKDLLTKAYNRGISPEYAGKLLEAFEGKESKPVRTSTSVSQLTTSSASLLVEPLSERETQVLRLLGTDLSIPEIADELFIAVSTVRSHIKNIYGKLDVHSRFEAVTKADELNLL